MKNYITSLINLFLAYYYSRLLFWNPKKSLQYFHKVDKKRIKPKHRLLFIEILRDNGYIKRALEQLEKYEDELKGIADSHYVKALLLEQLDQREKAIDSYEKALNIKPKKGRYWSALAINYLNMHRDHDAIHAYKNAIKNESKESTYSSWYGMGEAYLNLEDYENAKNAFKKAVQNSNEVIPRYYYRLAIAHHHLNETEQAKKMVVKATKLHEKLEKMPDKGQKYYLQRSLGADSLNIYRNEANEHGGYRYLLFVLLKESGNIDEALKVIEQAIELYPNEVWLKTQLANFYREMQNVEKAIAILKQEIRVNPEVGDIYYYLGEMYMEMENFHEAETVFTAAIKQLPENENEFFFYERHKVYTALGEYQKALKDISYVISKNPHANVYYDRSFLYFQTGQFQLALEDLQTIISYDSEAGNDTGYQYALGNTYIGLGMFELAEACFTYCLENNHNNKLHLLERRAECYLELGEFTKALNDCNEGLNIEPNLTPLLWIRGLTYLRLESPLEALNDAEKFIELEEGNPLGYYNIGLVYEELNNDNEAIAAYSTAITLDETYAPAYYRRAYLYNAKWENDKVITDLYHWLMYIDSYQFSMEDKVQLLEEQAWIDSEVAQEVIQKYQEIYGDSSSYLS